MTIRYARQQRRPPMDRWLESALDYIPSWLEFQLRLSRQPGCVVAVAHHGEIVLERAFGYADCLSGEALTPRHRFRVASLSKSLTAAGIMKLREQGRLRLDDRVGRYLAGLHPIIAQATISQVLSHGAGLFRDGADCGYFAGRRPYPDTQELLADFRAPPAIEPDTRFKYSNHGFGLLGLVMEAITGEPYRSWIKREIIDAGGLAETVPDMPMAGNVPFARGHTDGLLLGRRVLIAGDYMTGALVPASGCVSSAADMARFFSQLSPGSERSVISLESRREMTRRLRRNPHSSMETYYGLGIISGEIDGWNWFGHSGGLPGYVTRSKVLPDQDLAVCVLTNAVDGLAELWINGTIHILQAFRQRGAPSDETESWKDRWWTVWGAVDLVPMGEVVLVANPHLAKPLMDASELQVTGRDTARIALASGFFNHGEGAHRKRDDAGRITELWLAGDKLLPQSALAAEIEQQYIEAFGHP
jgi:CubicO group peptidase (beta-lactamase class C family)